MQQDSVTELDLELGAMTLRLRRSVGAQAQASQPSVGDLLKQYGLKRRAMW
jgi:hypothetical protein